MSLTATEEALVRQLLDQQAAILSLAGNEATITSKLGATKVTLSDLVSASAVADADLFLLRQGTTDKSVAGSIVKALATQPDASETVKGIVELATSAEVIAGTDTVRAVTPAGLAAARDKDLFILGASVAANALTVTLDPAKIDFRSATLTSGAINTRNVSSQLSITVPSGATLGTVNGQESRIAILAIDNAGTVELAVTNVAGGNALNEIGLISTTVLDAASDAKNVYYSTTARSNVAYRVLGYIRSTQTTAGTWASAPAQVQGAGGQAFAALDSIGYGQSWGNVTGSRAKATTYYNTYGKPITLRVRYTSGTGTIQITVDGVVVAESGGASGFFEVQTIIQPGLSYSYDGLPSVNSVWELK